MNSLYNDFNKAIRFYQQTHNECLPAKIIFQSQEIFRQLKLPAWLLNVPRDVNDKIDVPWIFIEPKPVLHHRKCCVCGLVRDVMEFEHELDDAPLCNHCFKKLFTKDGSWEKVVKEQNDEVKKCMFTDYLDAYEEILFGKKE